MHVRVQTRIGINQLSQRVGPGNSHCNCFCLIRCIEKVLGGTFLHKDIKSKRERSSHLPLHALFYTKDVDMYLSRDGSMNEHKYYKGQLLMQN